jgi:ABC-type transporter Mla maintaining outer membrane lipid asymmetry ATPase subunit MlaF
MDPTPAAIAVESVVKRFGKQPVLDGVSFEIAAGESLAVLDAVNVYVHSLLDGD